MVTLTDTYGYNRTPTRKKRFESMDVTSIDALTLSIADFFVGEGKTSYSIIHSRIIALNQSKRTSWAREEGQPQHLPRPCGLGLLAEASSAMGGGCSHSVGLRVLLATVAAAVPSELALHGSVPARSRARAAVGVATSISSPTRLVVVIAGIGSLAIGTASRVSIVHKVFVVGVRRHVGHALTLGAGMPIAGRSRLVAVTGVRILLSPALVSSSFAAMRTRAPVAAVSGVVVHWAALVGSLLSVRVPAQVRRPQDALHCISALVDAVQSGLPHARAVAEAVALVLGVGVGIVAVSRHFPEDGLGREVVLRRKEAVESF